MKQNKVPKNEYINGEPSPYRKNHRKLDRIVDPNVVTDPMGYWNPDNIGKVVQVPTDDGHITMQGVTQHLMGMDEYGNTQHQVPGQEYQYPGKFITEYPMNIAQKGKQVQSPPRTLLNTASQFVPGYEQYLDWKSLISGLSTGNKNDMYTGVIGLAAPFSGKALGNTVDYITEKTLGKDIADQNQKKRESIVNMSQADREKLFLKYGHGGYDAWAKEGYPELARGGALLNKSVTCSNCGWSWKAVDGGTDITTCHKCGGTAKLKYGGIPRAQSGKQVNTLEGDLIAKVLMNRNRDKDFVKRAYDVGAYPDSNMFTMPDPDNFGSRMSHKMGWGEDESGQAWMYPEVMNPGNQSIKVPNQYADYISSIGYKHATGIPTEKNGGWLDDYADGGDKKEVPPYQSKDQKDFNFRKQMYNDSLNLYQYTQIQKALEPGMTADYLINNPSSKTKENQFKLQMLASSIKNSSPLMQWDLDRDAGPQYKTKDGVIIDSSGDGKRYTKEVNGKYSFIKKAEYDNLKKQSTPQHNPYSGSPDLSHKLIESTGSWWGQALNNEFDTKPVQKVLPPIEQNKIVNRESIKEQPKMYANRADYEKSKRVLSNPPPKKQTKEIVPQEVPEYLEQRQQSLPTQQQEPELRIPSIPQDTTAGKRIAWRQDPTTKKMIPVIGGMKEKVKDMKRLYNKDIPSGTGAIPEGFVPNYGEDIATNFQYGGWLDNEEFKRGGMVNPLMKSRSKRSGTSKNIQSSINKIFLRNHDIFGPGGKNIYNPKSKYKDGGGWLDDLH